MSIEHQLTQSLANRIYPTLVEYFVSGSDANAKMKELSSEDPAIAAKRKFLAERIERLTEIKQQLVRFGTTPVGSP